MSRELEIVERIVLGIDPTGRGEPLNTPRDPGLDKAWAVYYEQLKRVCRPYDKKEPSGLLRAGKEVAPRNGERWTIAEDNRWRPCGRPR